MPEAATIVLAPMEGVLDVLMRDLLTNINCYDLCITEFIRVVDALVPQHIFHRICPELRNGGITTSKTPLRIQLLGQSPEWMAENANRAISLGSHGVDINFGCPAKAVNKSKGGAVLLKDPQQIYEIVSAVKKSVGQQNIVSTKIRLGFDDTSLLEEIVDAIIQAKSDQLTIHARTKQQGYRAPAYWQFIGQVRQKFNIDVIANGEVWNKGDATNCIIQSNSRKLMLGRGALTVPNLANVIMKNEQVMSWESVCLLLIKYSEHPLMDNKAYYFSSRLKQWLKYLRLNYLEADTLFNNIKKLSLKQDILPFIHSSK